MRQLQVVKIGTSTVFGNGEIDYGVISRLGYDLAKLRAELETDSVLVVSGSIPLGMGERGMSARPTDPTELQACAGIGQPLLVNAYTKGLREGYQRYSQEKRLQNLRLYVRQYEVTYHNLEERAELRNIVRGLWHNPKNEIIPVVNYNDNVDPAEVARDNDGLAAQIAKAAIADRLVILTDVDGLLDTEDKLIKRVREINDEVYSLCRQEGNGTGRMRTKIDAINLLLSEGTPAIMGNGRKYGLIDLIQNEGIRTLFAG